MITDLVQTLQAAIATVLTTGGDLTGLTVVTSDDLRAVDKVQAALAGSGLVAIVISPDLTFLPEQRIEATTYVRVIENVLQNRSGAGTGTAGSYWATHIASWLWKANIGETWEALLIKSITQVDGAYENCLEYLITINTACGFYVDDETPVVPTP